MVNKKIKYFNKKKQLGKMSVSGNYGIRADLKKID